MNGIGGLRPRLSGRSQETALEPLRTIWIEIVLLAGEARAYPVDPVDPVRRSCFL